MKKQLLHIPYLHYCFTAIFTIVSLVFYAQDNSDSSKYAIFSLSLSELAQLEVRSTTLADVKNNLTPTPSIIITNDDIVLSGARNLDELLEIYVPGFIMMYKGQTFHSIGVRGLISDRNNKGLVLVNGRIMNEHSAMGVISERGISMLNDIEKIEVIQSPQSSLYGSGAVSFVINIFTKGGQEADTITEAEIAQGVIDQYTSMQLYHSRVIKKDFSYSVFYGGDIATGAKNAHTKLAFSGITAYGDTLEANKPIESMPLPNLNSSANNKMRHKLHSNIKYKNFDAWVRYTNGGRGISVAQHELFLTPPEKLSNTFFKYQQLTALIKHKKKWGKLTLNNRISYDIYDKSGYIQPGPDSVSLSSIRERELYYRSLLIYNADKFSIATSLEASVETFGLPAFGETENQWYYSTIMNGNRENETALLLDENGKAWADSVNEYGKAWTTKMLSGVVELQYLLNDNISIIGGTRIDKHDYTKVMVSPRVAMVIKTPSNHLFRMQYSTANRRNDDMELRQVHLANNVVVKDHESIDFYEVSGNIQIKKLAFQPSVYYADYDNFGWDWRTLTTKYTGTLQYWGAELSAIYRSKNSYLRLSHNYIKQISFTLPKTPEGETEPDNPANNLSILGGSYSKSFRNFPDHLTKAVYQHKVTKKIAISSSLQITWYLQGAHDGALYQEDLLKEKTATLAKEGIATPSPAYHQAYTEGEVYTNKRITAFKPSAYLHFGYHHTFNKHFSGSIHGYNLLGLINDDLNKRTEFQRNSMYRIQPVSATLKVGYTF